MWILVAAMAIAAGCISGKRGPRGGTNIGSADQGGPWTQGEGGTPASPPPP